MALFELSMIISAIVEINVEALSNKLGRRESVLRILKRLNLESVPAANDFDAIYAHTLVEYGVFKPAPILNFFRNEFIRKAFRQAFYENNWAILESEAEEIIEWNQETEKLGRIEYDPRREFANFTAVFHQIVDNTRTPSEVKHDQKLEDVHQKTETILKHVENLETLEDIRAELTQLRLISQRTLRDEPENTALLQFTNSKTSIDRKDMIRWLHLSDFHVGKDGYGQGRLFNYLLSHIRTRVEVGLEPDLVFITGDIANKGKDIQYQEFNDKFLLPLLDYLPSETSERIFIIPGNHDVNREQARAVQTYDVLLRVPEFLDPTEFGQFERQTIFPRFLAFTENDLINSDEHWLISPRGTNGRVLSIRGQKIGVLGINTAWLSWSDQDRNRLSIGKGLLEDGLEALQGCDYKVVLGHHPLDWFLDSEYEPIRSLLGRHNALYLHGHLHKGRASYLEGAGYPFLALQAGAAFQAREDDMWVNRFLWCELDGSSREVSIEPLQWSRSHQEWVLDGSAFPNHYRRGDRWVLPIPSPTPVHVKAKTPSQTDSRGLTIPTGWTIVDGEYLKGREVQLNNEQILSYFDGRTPIWREALAPQIPRREIVSQLIEELEFARQMRELRVTLLVGAAGEGKTTALLQTVCELVNNSEDWNILWRYESTAPLPAEWIARLPDNVSWLIVSDDAEVIARRVFEAAQSLKLAGRQNVQFLLCCRDTDWKAEGADRFHWKQYVTFIEKQLCGLNEEDARKIVIAWSNQGKEGLKDLAGLAIEAATSRLLEAAKSETVTRQEGTFFGAVLQVRLGDGLKAHVDDLLVKLDKYTIGNSKTLRDAFAYIAAVHAEDLPILSREVLAETLQVKLADIKRTVLYPLGEEAAIATTGRFVFTRHRAIAKAVLQILSDTDLDIENLYIELAQSATRLFRSGTYVPEISKWSYLSSYFFEKGEHILGIRLAKAMVENNPDNSFFVVKLAQLYRDVGQPELSVQVFRSTDTYFKKNLRPHCHEWGLCEGQVGNFAVAIWLMAFALADEAARHPPDIERTKLTLAGIALIFADMYYRFNMTVFIEACGASAQLGLRLKLDATTKNWLIKNKNRAMEAGVQEVSSQIAFERFKVGIMEAGEQCAGDNLPQWIIPATQLHFQGLARLLQIQN